MRKQHLGATLVPGTIKLAVQSDLLKRNIQAFCQMPAAYEIQGFLSPKYDRMVLSGTEKVLYGENRVI